MLDRSIAIALVSIEFGYQRAETLSDEFCGEVAEHPLGGRVDCLDNPAARAQGDDAIHHGVQNRLGQRGTVPQGLLRRIVAGDIAEHQHGADHLTVAIPDRCATVGDVALAAIECDQHGVIRQALHRATRQGFQHRNGGGLPGLLVDDVKDLAHPPARGLRLRPTGELFGKRVEERHARFGVGRDHGITDGVERDLELLLADLQSDVGLLQAPVHLLLNLEQTQLLGFDLFARGVVGADQQIADDGACRIAQGRDRHDRGEATAVLAEVGQLVDVLDATRGLEDQCLEARRDPGSQLETQRLCARDQFLRIGDVRRGDLVEHIGSGIAQHALGTDVEDLDDTLLVGGDAREVGAVQNCGLQGPRLEQRLLTPHLREAARSTGIVGRGEPAFCFGHGKLL